MKRGVSPVSSQDKDSPNPKRVHTEAPVARSTALECEVEGEVREERGEVRWNCFGVPGLLYTPNWLSNEEHDQLLENIDKGEWQLSLSRRVQQYGFTYDYSKRAALTLAHPIPPYLHDIAQRLLKQGVLTELPDQVIVNEYQPGQGISKHIDKPDQFKDRIVSISLGSDCAMEFTYQHHKKAVLLSQSSLLCLSQDARWKWYHAIPKRKTDRNILAYR